MKKALVLLAAIFCILCFPVETIMADTDGSEQQVAQPEKLELQLGPEWAGVEFQLKTDAGLYPGTIVVDEDGVLRTEIGGSQNYILSCMSSSAPIPHPNNSEQALATNADKDSSNIDVSETADSASSSEANTDGVPVAHIVFFAGGLLLSVGCLIALHFVKRNKEIRMQDEDNEDEE